MQQDKPFIHLFQTPGGKYLYDANRNNVQSISGEVYEALEKQMNGEQYDTTNAAVSEKISQLKKQGFLSPSKIDKVIHPLTKKLPDFLNHQIHQITLEVTQSCNLRCKYCAYSGNYLNREHSGEKMDIEVAKKAIDFMVLRSGQCDEVAISFYGGEPLLRMDFLKECIEYSEQELEGRKVIYQMTTNGTLLNEEILDFLQEHSINITISLDGPEEVHDKNRVLLGSKEERGSFAKVMENLKLIVEKYPDYQKHLSFNTVMDERSDFKKTSDFFHHDKTVNAFDDSLFASVFIEETFMKDEPEKASDEFREHYSYEVFKYYLTMFNRLNKDKRLNILNGISTEVDKLHKNLTYSSTDPTETHHGGPCIPGSRRLYVNSDGTFFPCERVSHDSELMKIGHLDTGFDLEKVENVLNVGKVTEEDCKSCWAYRQCYLCAKFADSVTSGYSAEEKRSYCKEVLFQVEENLKSYCMLREFEYDFDYNSKEEPELTKLFS